VAPPPGAGGANPPGGRRGAGYATGAVSDWREWWKRNEWRFTRVKVKKIEATGGGAGQKGRAWHLKTIRDFLLGLLKDEDIDVRSSACIALGKLGDGSDRVRASLEACWGDPIGDVRVSALTALGMLRCRESAPMLMRILQDQKEQAPYREAASVALGQIGDPASVMLLAVFADRAKEKKVSVRASAALALGLVRDERSGAVLLPVLQGRDKQEVRALAASSLLKLGFRTLTIRGGAKGRRVDLVRLMERYLYNRKESPEVRCSIALGLGALGDEKTVKALMHVVRTDPDSMVRAFSFISLAELHFGPGKDEKIPEFLVRSAQAEKDRIVRPYLFLALGITKDGAGTKVLQTAFLEGSIQERGAAALGLGMIRCEGAVKMLGDELSEPKTAGDARWYACQALGLIGNEEAGKRLNWVLDNISVPYIQAGACKGLAILGDRTAITKLVANLGSNNQVVRTWAARSLGYYRDVGTVPRLVDLIGEDKTEEVRALSVVSLGIIGDVSKEIPVLRRISDHCNWMPASTFVTVSLVLRLI